MKKLNIGGYFNILAAILGIVGTVLTIITSTMSVDNQLTGLPLIAGAGIVGAVLCLLSIYGPTRSGNFEPVGTVSLWAAIALYCYTFSSAVSQRVMLIAGLFSFNSNNQVGWSIFYLSAAAWACLLVGCLVLILSGFLRTVRENA